MEKKIKEHVAKAESALAHGDTHAAVTHLLAAVKASLEKAEKK